jgi:non-specific serine/threonine protein kinase
LIGVGFGPLFFGHIAEARSLFAEARSLVNHFDEEARDGPLLRVDHWEGRVAQEDNDLDRAKRNFEECLAKSRDVNNKFRQLLASIVLGQVHLDLGDVREAAVQSIEALRLANRVGSPFRAGHCLSQLACVSVAAGDYPRAAVLLGAEAGLSERFALGGGFDFYKPRVVERDLVVNRLGEAAFAQAWERGRSLTMAQVVEEAAALVSRIETPGPKGALAITPREIEVLALVAEGQSNREIADQLFLSHRTVEAHMASILAKLDVDSRHKAVVAARDRGLLSTPR